MIKNLLNATKNESYSPEGAFTKEFISKAIPPHPYPLPPGERESIISPPLTGGD
jgi:hypothetical protein